MSSQECYPDKAPAIDRLLDTLGHHLRREVVHYFENCATTETVQLTGLVAHVDSRVPDATDTIRMELHHAHLPKLDERGWLDYDTRTGTIQYHGHGRAAALTGEVHDIF